jgi:glutamate-1-semialdehyde 2,1-aminomutase
MEPDMRRDNTRLIEDLSGEYAARFPRSGELAVRAERVMVDGGSHGFRLTRPFPVRIESAQGAFVCDVDGHDLLDFWQGHFANILGNDPEVVTSVLAEAFAGGAGLQLGQTEELQIETAELVCDCLHADKVRFTTSGSLSTMYAIMLARAFTGRDLVLKVATGWHGAQPWGLNGVYNQGLPRPWGPESEGLPGRVSDEVVLTRFNELEALEADFRACGDRLACFIVEPHAGAGSFIFAHPEYLRAARELCERYGVLLIFDEVISAFRFCPGDLGSLYGIRPDLVTVGKIVGGGMPVAAVAGRDEVMALCGEAGGNRVAFTGGTYSAHPASLLAAKTMVSYLREHEAEVYPRLAALGDVMRRRIADGFAAGGVEARCTGGRDEAGIGSSLTGLHFPHDPSAPLDRPHVLHDPDLSDVELSHKILHLALLLEDVYVLYGCCAASTAHTEADMERLGQACAAAARRIRPYL